MNSSTRQDVLTKLFNSDQYSDLRTNRSRVEYVWRNVLSYEQCKHLARENITHAKYKNDKSLSLAVNYKTEADMFLQQASIGPINQQKDYLERALKSYTKSILYLPIKDQCHLAAKLYSRKCQIHLQLNDYDAALYSVNIALDILEHFLLVPDRRQMFEHTLTYQILKINCLKMNGQYEMAMKLLNHLIQGIEDDKIADHEQLKQNLFKMKSELQLYLPNDYGFLTMSEVFDDLNDDLQSLGQSSKTDQDSYFSYRFDDRCQIEQSPVVGRHFIALEDIPENTVILEEKPYSIIIEQDYLHKKCSHCYRTLKHRFFPCLFCKELAFCDLKCFQQAYKLFHQSECGIISVLKSLTSPSFHVFRMLSRVGPINAYQAEQCKKDYSIDQYLAEPRQRTVPEPEKTLEEKLRAYKMSAILWDHDSKHSNYSNVHHIVLGIELVAVLDLVHNLKLSETSNYGFLLDFTEMVILDIRRIIFNVFGWHEYNSDWTLRGHVANCQCLVGSLINHSCVPNTNWEINNGQIKFTTNKLIRKGEEITITYGPHKDISYDRRQERLNHYFFACRCEACVNDARKGHALHCPMVKQNKCHNGLIPFQMSLQQEPVLYGQCLLCFQKYPDFEARIKEYEKCLKHLKELSMLAPFASDHCSVLLQKSIDLIGKFCSLSTPSPNPYVHQAVMLFTNIIRNINLDGKTQLDIAINVVDCNLAQQMALHDHDDQTLENLYYWFEIIRNYIEDQTESSIVVESDQQLYGAWQALGRFQTRLDCLLQQLSQQQQLTSDDQPNDNCAYHQDSNYHLVLDSFITHLRKRILFVNDPGEDDEETTSSTTTTGDDTNPLSTSDCKSSYEDSQGYCSSLTITNSTDYEQDNHSP